MKLCDGIQQAMRPPERIDFEREEIPRSIRLKREFKRRLAYLLDPLPKDAQSLAFIVRDDSCLERVRRALELLALQVDASIQALIQRSIQDQDVVINNRTMRITNERYGRPDGEHRVQIFLRLQEKQQPSSQHKPANPYTVSA